MEYKCFVDNFSRVACVLSVNLKETDSNIRYLIVDANDAYKRTVVQNIEDFAVDVPYTRYIPKAKNFEDLCDSCVLNDKPIHTYFDSSYITPGWKYSLRRSHRMIPTKS